MRLFTVTVLAKDKNCIYLDKLHAYVITITVSIIISYNVNIVIINITLLYV